MGNIGDILERHKGIIESSFVNRIKEIDNKIEELAAPFIKEKKELQEALKMLNTPKSNNNQLSFETNKIGIGEPIYSPSLSVLDKAILVIERNGELTLNEVSIKIQERESGINLATLKNNLSAVFAIDAKKTEPKLFRRKNNENKWVYDIKR